MIIALRGYRIDLTHILRGANLFLNMEVEFLRELKVLQYIASGLGGMLPPIFFILNGSIWRILECLLT